MPRPKKNRRVCGLPNYCEFGPLNKDFNHNDIVMITVEEFEVVRLMDLEGLEQEECAKRMDVARSTVQRMYIEAKRKVADSLVNGKVLKVEGGNYVLCELNTEHSICKPCYRGRHRHGRNNK